MQSELLARMFRPYLLTLAALIAAIGIRWAAEPWLHGQVPFITLFGAVAVGVWLGGVGPGIAAASMGFLAVAMLLSGSDNFDPALSSFWLFLLGYGFSCALIIGFGEKLRRARRDLSAEAAQRRRAEQVADQSEQDFRNAVELNPQVSWTALPDGQIEYLSERWREWTGITNVGEAWRQGLHPDDRTRSLDAWAQAARLGQTYDVEHRIRRADGSYRWARSRANPRRDAAGRVVKWYGSTEDIHAAKLAAAALENLNATLEHQVAERTAELQASEARMRAVFSTTYQFQWLLKPDGTVLDANAVALRGMGAGLDEVVGRFFWETPWFTATPRMPEQVQSDVQLVSTGDSVHREITVKLPTGERIFDFAMRPVIESDGSITAIVPEGVDITERHRAERQLRTAQKMHSVGHLTGGIAHDFNNLLQVISSNLQLIGRSTAGDAAIEKRLAVAGDAIDRGARLASQLLAFGRRQALQPKVLDIGQLIRGMADTLHRSTGPSIEIETHFQDGLWNTLVDPAQIELALLNLANNARDAMDDSGRLTISVENVVLDEVHGHADDGASAGEHVVVAVRDNGRGMSAEVLAQACEPFFSTKAVDTGSGLGLSMVYGFVKQSGGHVVIHSEVGRGTTVSLHFPRSTREPDMLEDKNEGPLLGGTETVLIAEDDAGVRNAAAEMLGELGYHVVTAGDATTALEIIERGTESIDLLFSDIVMPGPLKSIELAHRARQRLPALALLFTSGYTNREAFDGKAFNPNAALLPKPYSRDGLGRSVRSALDRGATPATAALTRLDIGVDGDDPSLNILLVEDDEGLRISTGELIRDLGHRVAEAGSAEQAMTLLSDQHFDVLMTDIQLPGQSGEVFAALARGVQPDLGIIFATGGNKVSQSFDGTDGPVLLRKPFDIEAIIAALKSASR